jgi:hypothetical protein
MATDLTSQPSHARGGKTNYESALEAARAQLRSADIPVQAQRLGGSLVREGGTVTAVRLTFMGKDHLISIPGGDVARVDGGDVPVFSQILVLHALLYHTGEAPAGQWISFSDIPDGLLYNRVYTGRTAVPLGAALRGHPGGLARAAAALGGRESGLGGDASAIVEPVRGIPVGIVYWEGDGEFKESITFLYDKTIVAKLPAEDIVVLTQCLVTELKQVIREMSS